jgi:hypothetical protein
VDNKLTQQQVGSHSLLLTARHSSSVTSLNRRIHAVECSTEGYKGCDGKLLSWTHRGRFEKEALRWGKLC